MVVVESSMAGGRKEVALAAIGLLSAVLQAHGSITDIIAPTMWKRAMRALSVGMEAATSPTCMVPLPVSACPGGAGAMTLFMLNTNLVTCHLNTIIAGTHRAAVACWPAL
jgi:hypothetical protein